MNEAKRVSQVYIRKLPVDQAWPQMISGKFRFLLVDGDPNQPGLKETEMARRAIERQRMLRDREQHEE